ncbi:MAG TPA: SIS domain-containing protein [Streptosporangiaceae bacterium]|nr:SIS domain-containing protein [Streptosporangiaceae bacterium]
MSASPTSPFERDIAAQPEALRAFAHTDGHPALAALRPGTCDRIVLTGMGSSHDAALPTWRRLVRGGLPAWWADTGQLLDTPELITATTLLIVTSQSGSSGEVVSLLESGPRPATLVAVTNDETSSLAAAADLTVALHSGDEATVSTKSYLNSLAAHDLLAATLTGTAPDDVLAAAKAVEEFSGAGDLVPPARELVAAANPRLAYIGFGDHAATARYAGLITKEGAKIAAEGFIGGQFRHGPLELAGPGLTAVLFGSDDPAANASLQRLGTDLAQAGSTVIAVAALDGPGAALQLRPPPGTMAQLAYGAVAAQHLTVAVARARGITPGEFAYGSKITTAL